VASRLLIGSEPNLAGLVTSLTLSPTPNFKSIDIKLWLWRRVEVSCFSTTSADAINTAKPCDYKSLQWYDYVGSHGSRTRWSTCIRLPSTTCRGVKCIAHGTVVTLAFLSCVPHMAIQTISGTGLDEKDNNERQHVTACHAVSGIDTRLSSLFARYWLLEWWSYWWHQSEQLNTTSATQ